MSDSPIEFQISVPTFNADDGRWYQRTRWVYDSNGDGTPEAVGEQIVARDDQYGFFNPSQQNQAWAAVVDLLNVAQSLVEPEPIEAAKAFWDFFDDQIAFLGV